jgi:NADH:ubiquinone oxidoreductase subunit 2 (subunit N)
MAYYSASGSFQFSGIAEAVINPKTSQILILSFELTMLIRLIHLHP